MQDPVQLVRPVVKNIAIFNQERQHKDKFCVESNCLFLYLRCVADESTSYAQWKIISGD